MTGGCSEGLDALFVFFFKRPSSLGMLDASNKKFLEDLVMLVGQL